MKRWMVVFVALTALVAGACGGSDDERTPTAFGGQDDDSCQQGFNTFDVKVQIADTSYSIGQKAVLDVTVVRSAKAAIRRGSDTHDLMAVEGAHVMSAANMGDVFLYGGGTTDAEGKATIAIKIARHAPLGSADVSTYAWKELGDVRCVHVAEEGSYYSPAAFKISR